jgi:hypothetical protein
MKEKREKLIVLLCMVGLVVIEIFGFNIINSVRHSQEQLNNEIQLLHQRVSDMEYNIPETVRRDSEASESKIHAVDIAYLSADVDRQEVSVDVFVTLKETTAGATYTLQLMDKPSEETKRHSLTYVSDTTYKVTLSLKATNNYLFSVIEEHSDGSKRLMSTVDNDLPIRDDLSYGRIEFLHHHIGLDNGELTLGFELDIKDYQLAGFGLQSVMLEVWYKGEKVVNQDIKSRLTKEPSSAMETYYTGASVGEEAYAYEEAIYEKERTQYYYDEALQIDALNEANLDQIEVSVTVKMNDGVSEYFTLNY